LAGGSHMLMPDVRNTANFTDLPQCRRIFPCAGGSHMLMPDARNTAQICLDAGGSSFGRRVSHADA